MEEIAIKIVGELARRTGLKRMERGVTVDSGAAVSVIPPGWTGYVTKESPGSKRGEFYISASNGIIFKQGQVTVNLLTKEGKKR